MAKKKKAPDSGPSKAYLVSFGDTMTALLAFFIVLNSLATEQTGANLYAGTGSFVTSFAKSGLPGGMPGNRSRDMVDQRYQAPIYALAENLEKNGTIGPDDTDRKDRIVNADRENFQKFLTEIEDKFGLNQQPPIKNQTVFDSFVPFDREDGSLSEHAIQLAASVFPKIRKSNVQLEVITWARMPSKKIIDQTLERTIATQAEIEEKFWLRPQDQKKVTYTVKPWLFSDAKRPVISFVLSESRE